MHHRVLVVSASMGAGHDGAARELTRRLETAGHEVVVRDFLNAPRRPIGWILRRSYEMQLKYAAWSYEVMYRVWFLAPVMVAGLARLIASLSQRRLLDWIRASGADVVVSTYPLSSQALATMRRKGKTDVPVATFLTDFGIHPLWVDAHVGLHIAVHPQAADEAARRGAGTTLAPGPLVREAFTAAGRAPRAGVATLRQRVRAALALPDDARAVLIVAGSWGVGDVAGTFRTIASSGRFTPIAVCGHDDRLRRRLERWNERHGGVGRVVGWTDDMPGLMTAADVLVENAGGLTAMEAFASGLPVVTYRPIQGHGRQNAAGMAAAGVTSWVRGREDLLEALDALSTPGLDRARQIAAGRALFRGDAAADLVTFADVAATAGAATVERRAGNLRPALPRRRLAAVPRVAARVAALAVLITAAGMAVDESASIATAAGLGVAHPQHAERGVAFLGVRLDAADLHDPAVVALIEQIPATAIIDAATAEADRTMVQDLAEHGVDVENGGAGLHAEAFWRRGRADVVVARRSTARISGERVAEFVPARRVDAIDLAWSQRSHTRVVVADRVIRPGDRRPLTVRDRWIYVVDGRHSSSPELVAALTAMDAQFATAAVHAAPLSSLR